MKTLSRIISDGSGRSTQFFDADGHLVSMKNVAGVNVDIQPNGLVRVVVEFTGVQLGGEEPRKPVFGLDGIPR